MGPQNCSGAATHTRRSVRVTNHRRYPGNDTNSNQPRMPPMMKSEENHISYTDHQRANTMNFKDHKKANATNSKLSNKTDCKGQHTSVTRPTQMKLTEKPQEHKCHKEILSVQIDDM